MSVHSGWYILRSISIGSLGVRGVDGRVLRVVHLALDPPRDVLAATGRGARELEVHGRLDARDGHLCHQVPGIRSNIVV